MYKIEVLTPAAATYGVGVWPRAFEKTRSPSVLTDIVELCCVSFTVKSDPAKGWNTVVRSIMTEVVAKMRCRRANDWRAVVVGLVKASISQTPVFSSKNPSTHPSVTYSVVIALRVDASPRLRSR